MENKLITSTKNALVKQITVLQEKSRERKKTGLFVIEGVREIELAIQGHYTIETLLFYSELFPKENIAALGISNTIEITKEVYQKIAYRTTTEGIIAIAKSKSNTINDLVFSTKTPLILIAEAPEKPGNIGAILRTADAANLDAVIIANPKTDLYNSNTIRSSVGCLFTNQLATGTTHEIIAYLKTNTISIYAASLQASTNYYTQDYTQATAIVVGTEATGLSQEWRDHAAQNIIIPMQGKIDSMNVSVAAGILVFEAKRQRDFK